MMKHKNPWIIHLNSCRKKYPKLGFKELAHKAKMTYKAK